MHTRKSSPLPGPKDNTNKYQINYQAHYLDLHKHLLELIREQSELKQNLIGKFTSLAGNLEKTKRKYEESDQLYQKENQIRSLMQPLYHEICLKQLQIKKLFDEAEGIVFQLYDMLKQKQRQIRNIRQEQGKSSTNTSINFLHHDNINLQQSISQTQCTQSVQQKDIDNSLVQKQQLTTFDFNKEQMLEGLLLNNQIHTEDTVSDRERTKGNKVQQIQMRQALQEKSQLIVEQSNGRMCEQDGVQGQQMIADSSPKMDEYILLQIKAQQKRQSFKLRNRAQECIQISSSIDEQQQKRRQEQKEPYFKFQNNHSHKLNNTLGIKYSRSKPNIKKCITILD